MKNKKSQIDNQRLIILGNGFDIEHGLSSTWKQIFENKDELFSINAKTNILKYIEDSSLWSDFENATGAMVLSFYSFFKETKKEFKFLSKEDVKMAHEEIKEFIDYALPRLGNISYDEENYNAFSDKIREIDEEMNNKLKFKDNTIKIKIILVNQIIKKLNDFKFKKKHPEKFNRKTDYVLNYNYTDIAYGDNGYFDEEKSLNIHGRIEKSWNKFTHNFDDESISSLLDTIELGLYEISKGISTDKNKHNNVKNIQNISSYMGINNIYFWKLADTQNTKWKRISDFFEPLKNIREILIFGHSLSGNDLPYIMKYINVSKISLITFIGLWDREKNDAQKRAWIKKNINKIFGYKGEINIINNKR